MIAAGLRALARHARLALSLYLVQLGVALLLGFIVWFALGSQWGDRPIFAELVGGDLESLVFALRGRGDLLEGLLAAGVALALGYAVLSFYLAAGLIGRLRGEPFGVAAGRRMGAFFRLWLWAAIPGVIALVIAGRGVAAVAADPTTLLTGEPRPVVMILGALPGLLCYAIVGCAVDLARVHLVADARLGAGRAFLRGLGAGWPYLHYVGFGALWWGVGIGYLIATFDLALGAGLLLVLRQLVSMIRFAARFATTAGQVAWVTGSERQVLERGQLVEGAEARADLVGGEGAQPVD